MDDKNMDKRKEIVSERCFNISNPNFITRIRLNTENYPRWKQALEMFAKECKLMKHLLKPPPTNPSEDWVSHDAMLHRLITETMEEEIALQVFKCSTAYSIWSYLKEMFEGKFNANRVFDTWRALNKLERGNRSVSFYYGEIKKLELELLSIYPISSEEKGWKTYHDHMMVMTFLAGLGPEYDNLHPKILGGSDVPSLADAYKIILRAYPTSVVEGTSNSTVKEEEDKSALISSYDSRGRGKGSTRGRGRGRIFPGGKGRGSDCFCSHCEMIGHTKDFCYSLHPELRSQKAAKYATRDMTYTTSTSHGTTGLSEEEISRLRTLLAESTPDLKTEEIIDSGRESGDFYHFDGRPLKVVHFRSLERPKEEDFCLELSKLFTYDDVVERVARQLGLDDPSKIRLTSHNCNSQQPKPQPIKYRGVEHLSDMLVHYNQTSDILYYEVLDIPLPELQYLKTLKVAFHHATKDEVVIHSIRLPKNCTVDDLIDVLKTKVELSYPNTALRLLEVFYHKIYKIFPPNEKIENINDQYWTLRAEEIPEEEKNLGPHDRLIHVYHFMKDPNQNQMLVQNFGEPFFLVIHEGETLAEVKARIQKKLQVPDEEFSKWKFAFLSLGRPEYLQDSDIVSIRFQRRDVYGSWEQYLGLEHADTAPKKALYSQSESTHV